MKKLAYFVLALLVCFMTIGQTLVISQPVLAEDPPVNGTISGTVTDASNSAPLSNIHVEISDANSGIIVSSTDTDINGNYTVQVPAGSYLARTNSIANGHYYVDKYNGNTYLAFLAPRLTVTEGSEITGINFSITAGGLVSGTVVDSETNLPIPNISIAFIASISGTSAPSAKADQNGYYSIVIPPGTYKAATMTWVTGLSYVDEYYNNAYSLNAGTPFTVNVAETVTNIDFSLAVGGRVSGKVIDEQTSSPLSFIFMMAADSTTGESVQQVVCGLDGTYAMSLPAGTYTISANAINTNTNYSTEYYNNAPNPRVAIPITVTVPGSISGIDFSLIQGPGIISGTVTDANNPGPIANLTVQAYTTTGTFTIYSTTTDSDGRYELVVPAGTYTLRTSAYTTSLLFADKWYPNTYDYALIANVTVGQNENISGYDFSLEQGSLVSGTVTDSVTHQPISNVMLGVTDLDVNASGLTCLTFADQNGQYAIVLHQSNYLVQTFSITQGPNYLDEYYDNVLSADQATPIDVTTGINIGDINFALDPRPGTISGTVLDASTFLPIANMRIEVTDNVTNTIVAITNTDAAGHYITQVPDGKYTIRTNSMADGLFYVDKFYNDTIAFFQATPITVTGTGVNGIDFSLTPGGSVSGNVIDSDTGLPVSNLIIIFLDNTTGLISTGTVTDQYGNYSVVLPPGIYRSFTADWISGQSYVDKYYGYTSPDDFYHTFVVTTGEAITGIDFSLAIGGSVTGIVTGVLPSQPSNTIFIVATDYLTDGYIWQVPINPDGHYTMNLPAGVYRLKTYVVPGSGNYTVEYYNNTNDFSDATPVTITVPGNVTGIDFSLDQIPTNGTICGTVTDTSTSLPISNMRLDILDFVTDALIASINTDASGYYSIQVPPGNYKVHTRSLTNSLKYVDRFYNGVYYTFLASQVTVAAGQIVSDINLSLEPGGVVSGTATYGDNSLPIPNLLIGFTNVITGVPSTNTVTDQNGIYSVVLPPGVYKANSSAWLTGLPYVDEYYGDVYAIELAATFVVLPNHTMTGIDFSLAKGGKVTGTVIDANTLQPLNLFFIEARDFNTNELTGRVITQPDGRYSLTLPAGLYRIQTSGSIFGSSYVDMYANNQYGWHNANPVAVTVPNETPNINFSLKTAGFITGTILDSGTSQPIVNMNVYAVGFASNEWTAGTFTDNNGVYTLKVPSGLYKVGTSAAASLLNYTDEWYNNQYSWQNAAAVVVSAPNITSSIDFSLGTGSTITGTIRDASTLLPIPNISVSATDYLTNDWITGAATDINGNYTLRLPSGTYRVRTYSGNTGIPYADKYYDTYNHTAATPVIVTEGGSTPGIDIALELGGIISGTVSDETTHLPIAGMNVIISDPLDPQNGQGRLTDEYGRYSLTLPSGTYVVQVMPSFNGLPYLSEYYDGVVQSNLATQLFLMPGATINGIDFSLQSGTSISGTVRDAISQIPLVNVSVTATDYASNTFIGNTNTDGNGNYTLRLPAGTYRLRTYSGNIGIPYADKYYNNTYSYMAATPVAVTEGVNVNGIDFNLEMGGIISGTVINGTTYQPFANMLLIFSPWTDVQSGQGVMTDQNGNYSIILPPGIYRGQTLASAFGLPFIDEYYNGKYQYHLADPITVTAGVNISGIDFTMNPGSTISGTIRDENTQLPLVNISVTASVYIGNQYITRVNTDADGNYTLRVPAGSYRIQANAQNSGLVYADKFYDTYSYQNTTPVEVTNGSSVSNININLQQGSFVSGSVLEAGTLLPPAMVFVNFFDFTTNQVIEGTPTDQNGNYSLVLPPGTYRAQVNPSQNGLPYLSEYYNETYLFNLAEPINVTVGVNVSGISFSLESGSTISGTIRDAVTLVPLNNIIVNALDYNTNQFVTNAFTDANGNYTLRVPAGDYRIRTYSGNSGLSYVDKYFDTYDNQSATKVTAEDGGNVSAININLDQGSLVSGRVIDSSTLLPIANVNIGFTDYTSGDWVEGTMTNWNGEYSMVLRPGIYKAVAASSWNGLPYVNEFYGGTYIPNQATPVNVTLGTNQNDINFSLDSGATISGTLRDTDTNQPIANVNVMIMSLDFSFFHNAVTDANGYYAIHVPAGVYRAQTNTELTGVLYVDKFYANTYSFVEASLITVLENSNNPNNDINLEPGILVTGNIDDSAAVESGAFVIVNFFDAITGQIMGGAIADKNGNYSKVLPDGNYRMNHVSILFDNIIVSGDTTVIVSDQAPGATSGFSFIDSYYDVKTTSEFSGNATVTFTYTDADIPAGQQEEDLRLFHWTGTEWIDITTSLDTVNNIITGSTPSFSWFGIGVLLDTTPPVITVSGVTDGGTYANTVTPVIEIMDENPGTQTISLNGQAYQSGTAVTNNGSYSLAVSASDAFGNTSNVTVNFIVNKNLVTIRLNDSLGYGIAGATIQYYSGGWQDGGVTNGNGETTTTLTPKNYSFRVTYDGRTVTKSQNTSINPLVIFQTVNTVIQLKNSAGNLIDGGTVQYYNGAWQDLGVTTGGVVYKELLPTSYSFRMTYGGATISKSQNISTDPIVVFQAVNVTVQLKDSLGNALDTGTVEYYAGGNYHAFGSTSGGSTTLDLLPVAYTFRMTYNGTKISKSQNVGTDPIVVFQTVNTAIQLKNSAGNLVDGGTVQYYNGTWQDLGVTTGGVVYKELLPTSYSFRMTYGGATISKSQNISTDPIVVFQAVNVTVQLKDSLGNALDTGTVEYYAGGNYHAFGSTSGGSTTLDLLPVAYTFRMTYNGTKISKSQNVGTDPIVVFQTVNTAIQLKNSAGNLVDGGTVQYYNGTWQDLGVTTGGVVYKELLPTSYSFRMTYGGPTISKSQNISTDPIVVFQAVNVTVQLKDSLGNALDTGTVEYYAGGNYHAFGSTSGGSTTLDLLPAAYTFRMTYNGTKISKSQNVGTDPIVVFQTVNTAIQLKNSTGNLMDGGSVQYYNGAWQNLGATMGGVVYKELLPTSYSFRMTYGGATISKSQNISTDPIVVFQAGQVLSASGSCTFYYAGGWKSFVNGMEILPGTYTFRFNDSTANMKYTIVDTGTNIIH